MEFKPSPRSFDSYYLIVNQATGLSLSSEYSQPGSLASMKAVDHRDSYQIWSFKPQTAKNLFGLQSRQTDEYCLSAYGLMQSDSSTQFGVTLSFPANMGIFDIREVKQDVFQIVATVSDGRSNSTLALDENLLLQEINAEDRRQLWTFVNWEPWHLYPGTRELSITRETTIQDIESVSVGKLLALSDSAIRSMIPDQFRLQMKNAESVKSFLFPDAGSCIRPVDSDAVDKLAITWVTEAVAHTTISHFSESIVKDNVDAFAKSEAMTRKRNAEGQNIYRVLFPHHLQDTTGSIRFQDYLDNKQVDWEAALYRHMTSRDFMHSELAAAHSRPNWVDSINLFIFIFKQFNPPAEHIEHIIHGWRNHFSDPKIADTWADTEFLPWSEFADGDDIMGIVSSHASIKTNVDEKGNKVTTVGDVNLGVVRFIDIATGLDLRNWVYAKAKPMGFCNDKLIPIFEHGVTSPLAEAIQQASHDYVEAKKNEPMIPIVGTVPTGGAGGAYACFIAGTPILLADGTTQPIESIRSGVKLLARDGISTITSPEYIEVITDRDSLIFGFQTEDQTIAPFASLGHVFHTTTGYRAIRPDIAQCENPHLDVLPLNVGDQLYRVMSTNPFRCEAVAIKRLQFQAVPAGTKLYGLHLIEGPPSYHACGFLVDANYPMITEWRLTHDLAKLSPMERAFVQRRFAELMPILGHAVGPFVVAPILRALQADSPLSQHHTKS